MTEYSHLVTLKSGLYSYAITNLGIIRGSNKTRHQKMWNIQLEGKSYICCVPVICVQYFRIHNLCRSKERKREKRRSAASEYETKWKCPTFEPEITFQAERKEREKKCITYYAINLATIRVGMGPKSFPDFIQQKTFLQNKREKVFALVYFLNVKGSAKWQQQILLHRYLGLVKKTFYMGDLSLCSWSPVWMVWIQ